MKKLKNSDFYPNYLNKLELNPIILSSFSEFLILLFEPNKKHTKFHKKTERFYRTEKDKYYKKIRTNRKLNRDF